MASVLRKLQYFRNLLSRQKPVPDEIIEEKWIADFSTPKHTRFDIKSESLYNANIRKNLFHPGYSMMLGLKKSGCIAWTEAPEQKYRDLTISGVIRIDAGGGYGAGGMFYRMVDSETYYSFLISNRGYFRLDAVRNGMPFPLVGWTELPLSTGSALDSDQTVGFSIIAYGSHMIITIHEHWVAEVSDPSILEGTICFAAASYESGDPAYRVIRDADSISYTTEAFLESLTVESRNAEVSALYEKWNDSPGIDPKARLRLAETYAAMEQHSTAMTQLQKAWAAPGYARTQGELLLAGRLSQRLGRMTDAESYISQCFQADIESPDGKIALTEMASILHAGERYKELKDFCAEAVKIKPGDPLLWNFQGHACWDLKEYKGATTAYDRAFELDSKNGIFAKNAANVCEMMSRKKEALARYIKAGKAFLTTGNYNDLGLLVPKLLSLGEDNWEARCLAGKWAFAVEDWKMAEAEFERAEDLRKAKRPKPQKDGAQIFLQALLLLRAGNRRGALPLLEEAVRLEKDYALFHFRYSENLFLLEDNPDDPRMLGEMEAALSLCKKDTQNEETAKESEGLAGWISNFAAQVALRNGNLDAAAKHLEKAGAILGDLPAVRVNHGVLLYLQGSLDKALELLSADKQDDSEGVMANCAGNLLVRSGRFEEADEKYRQALSIQSDNVEYLCNRATCLIELGRYGEADTLLVQAHTLAPGPALLEMISYVAAKKGEFPRAEQACRSALEIDPNHAPSLLSLGWVLLTLGRKEEVREIVKRLDKLVLKEDTAKSREELRSRLDELIYYTMECAFCDRSWKVLKDSPPAPSIRLYAMPPDDLPAGSCQSCGKTYCIGCAKENTDPEGRFLCPACGQPLKLVSESLKRIVYDWAVKDGLVEAENAKGKGKRKKGAKTAEGNLGEPPSE